jgi:hypothetical protein
LDSKAIVQGIGAGVSVGVGRAVGAGGRVAVLDWVGARVALGETFISMVGLVVTRAGLQADNNTANINNINIGYTIFIFKIFLSM